MIKTRGMLLSLVMALIALVLGSAVPAFAGGGDNAAKAGARKIVVFDVGVVNEAAQQTILERTGAAPLKSLPLVNAWVVLAGPASEKALEQHPGVLRVDDDAEVHALAKPTPKPTPTPPPETLPWGVDRIDADLAWATNTGAGIKVAVLDTGISLSHPDLVVAGGINTINPRKNANDDNGHGSHVAGIIAAVDNDIGVIGVAPQASLYAVKVLSKTGSGWVSDIIEGVQWSIANGMQVINMSLGTSSDVQSFHDALTAASSAGIVLVAAAGNSGPDDNTVEYPAKYAEVIAVSATDNADAITSWSSRGPDVELAAPGASILSTYKGTGYATLSGTSMASPHVAGTAALVLNGPLARDLNGDGTIDVNYDTNGNGKWDVAEVRAAMAGTADDLGAAGKDNYYGYGLVDAEEAATGAQTLP